MSEKATEPLGEAKNDIEIIAGMLKAMSLKDEVLERYKNSHGYSGIPKYRDFRDMTEIDRERYPLVLSTGSRKPQYFHARTDRVPYFAALEEAGLIEMNPADVKKYRQKNGGKHGKNHQQHGEPAGELSVFITGTRTETPMN